jgi:hypothetical protein
MHGLQVGKPAGIITSVPTCIPATAKLSVASDRSSESHSQERTLEDILVATPAT